MRAKELQPSEVVVSTCKRCMDTNLFASGSSVDTSLRSFLRQRLSGKRFPRPNPSLRSRLKETRHIAALWI